jgi:hypothetical protein
LHRARLKAPYHSCLIKQYPGLREFISDSSGQYSALELAPYSQPPSIIVMPLDGDDVVTVLHITAETTAQQVAMMLSEWGVQ